MDNPSSTFPLDEERLRSCIHVLRTGTRRAARNAFDELYRACADVLTGYAASVLMDGAVADRKEGRKVDVGADDVVHDVMSALWRRRHELRIRGRVSSYLLTAVHNRCLNRLQDDGRRISWPDDEEASAVPLLVEPESPDDDVYERELRELVRLRLSRLRPARRSALDLVIQGFDRREIAREMGISVAAADQRISRARKDLVNLRRWLREARDCTA